MKVPENFSASATKKISPLEAAIAGNFSQNSGENPPSNAREGLLTGEKPAVRVISPSEQNSPLKSDAKSQILNAKPAPAAEEARPSRREVKEKFLVSMSKGERSIFKSFCALQGVSMNHFVMCAMDYFKEDLENGKVSISSHSYKRKES